MIHIIPNSNSYINWDIIKPKSFCKFNELCSNIINYTTTVTLSLLPQYKQQPLSIKFYRIYPKQMQCLKKKYPTKTYLPSFLTFTSNKEPLGKIYLCTAFIENESKHIGVPFADYFTRIVIRSVLNISNVKNIDSIEQKALEMLGIFK